MFSIIEILQLFMHMDESRNEATPGHCKPDMTASITRSV